jgi:cytochrome c biogenesis protein CcmG/thiol:disulfide interchange protein DsbE
MRRWAPFAAFVAVLAIVALALFRPADRTVRSALVGKPLPALTLPASVPAHPGVSTVATGKPRLVNVFASWCVPCAAEAPQLAAMKQAGVTIVGVAIRDAPADTAAFLARYGDPYSAIGDDREGRFQLSVGSSGVPETFVVDARGRIALQHVGPIMDDDVPAIVAALRNAA